MSDDSTFKDLRGVTHEAIRPVNPVIGDVSLCGLLRKPPIFEYKSIRVLRGLTSLRPPDGVDCMTCLVQRTKLDRMVEQDLLGARGASVELELRIKSWS